MTGSSGPSYDGAFAIMGAVDPESFDTLHSFSNAFEMPFVTPWFPEKIYGRKMLQSVPKIVLSISNSKSKPGRFERHLVIMSLKFM